MSFTHRARFAPKPDQCPQCGKEDQIATRPDKLGRNCGKFKDDAAAKAQQHAEDVKKNAKRE